ncbi:hypothetical protein [Roseisolibacter sp. H3M3-2]|uniref:hypothetical protein n=1 Tax=Roseisolibacter sp. H3M3-2 TaxID=3031323 RepID=UPI0023DA2CF0|nr:hypothetical protein [Roseisolibacter sp. H3M3-2]MDF1503506.1 hypothetical protein [Roseisolibacter sp. H3M3-2]
MPRVPFDQLPDDARLWVFAAADPLDGDAAARLLAAVDGFLDRWAAHGVPLTCARDWRDDRFLAVAVDQSREGASGCSIDGLFRTLQGLAPALGTTLLGGGRVYWRDADGGVRCAERAEFGRAVTGEPTVFDTTVATAGDWRARFERPLRESWHARLVA